MDVHQKIKSEYSHGPTVLSDHYVSRTREPSELYQSRTSESSEHYVPRTSETNEHYVSRTTEQNDHYVPRTTEPNEHYAPRTTESEYYVSRSSEQSEHYVPRTSEPSGVYSPRTTEHSERYVSRSGEQTEHYVPRNMEHSDRYSSRGPEPSEPPPPRYIQRTPAHYIVRPPSYYPSPTNGEENSIIVLHPLIIGKDVVICMPEVNKVLRHVYQVLSQANYYLSKHGISSRRYTGAQLIRIKMLGILGHEAKVCSYILLKDAERVFDSFDVSGDCHKSPNISWMDPVLLDEKPIPEITRKSPDLSPQEPAQEGPVTVHLFKLDDNIIICAPDVQKVVQANFHQGATVGYYFTKLGIVPHKFLHTSHLDKVKELGIIKRSAVHCTYIMKSDAMSVFEAYGMDAAQVKDKVIFSDIIELAEGTSKSWKPHNISMSSKKEPSPNLFKSESPNGNSNSPTALSPKKECFSPNGVSCNNSTQQLVPNSSPTPNTQSPMLNSSASPMPDDEEERRLIPPDAPNDFTVNVFVVEGEEVVCMPDIHKIVQSIHGNSIQVNYYFNKLRVAKKRFCFAHLRELKARRILQNNATYCTYVPRADAEKLFQIYCLVDDPKLKEIIWTEPINLEVKLSDDSVGASGEHDGSELEDVTIHTFKLEDNIVITVPDVHKIVDFLDEQSASLDYHFRKLGIVKCRFTYSQLHQLRRLNVIKRPTVCTYVTRGDMDKLLGMYETERNRHKMERLKFLEPITLVAGTVPLKPKSDLSPVRFDEYMDASENQERPQFVTPESPGPNFLKPASHHNEIMSPNSAAISFIQNAHPAIDCPIVIPNGDYDPTKVNDDHVPPRSNDVIMNGKRKHFDHPDICNGKKLKYPPNPAYQGFINDINRKEDELRFLHDAYQREIEEERGKRIALEIKYDEARNQLHQINDLKHKLSSRESEILKYKEDISNERLQCERLERDAKTIQDELNKERTLREQLNAQLKSVQDELENERVKREQLSVELKAVQDELSNERAMREQLNAQLKSLQESHSQRNERYQEAEMSNERQIHDRMERDTTIQETDCSRLNRFQTKGYAADSAPPAMLPMPNQVIMNALV